MQVAQRGVDAPLAQRVYVELGETCDLLVADVLRPELCVGQIEALFGGEAVDRCGLLLAFERIVVGRVGDAQTALVGDVLAQAERAVGEEGRLIPLGGQYLDRIELLDQNVGLGLERGGVLFGPPVVHVAVLVEVAALVVESVGHLVADHHADGAVVDRVIGIGVVERRLENGRREADLVGRGIVVGVDRLRRHEPFVLVDRLAELAQIVERAPQARGLDVLPVALGGIDRERRIVLPLVGIADLDVERRQLLLRLGFRGVRHPVESGDVLAERRLQVPDQFEHPLLVLGREVFGDVHLAYGLAQHRVGDRHGAFPAGTLLLLAGHLTAEEVERSGIEVVAQVGCRAGEVLSGQVVA